MHYVGIDVSKAKLDCTWLRDPATGKIKSKKHDNTSSGHKALVQWLSKNVSTDPNEILVVMEATGIYHEVVAYALFEAGVRVCVANPARTKEFANSLGNTHKTDAKDSVVLAKYGYLIKPEQWQPEPPEARELKALNGHIEALEKDIQRSQNRLEKAEFNRASERVIKSLHILIEQLQAEKKRLESDIDDHIDRHSQLKKDRALMESIPGVGKVVSRTMLSVIHGRSFQQAGQLAAYIGLIPRIQESGTWRGKSRLSKQGSPKIRAKLYMPAVTSIQHNPDIRAQYERLLKNGKSKMQAIGAAMRKLVQICFGVVKHQSEYRPQVAI